MKQINVFSTVWDQFKTKTTKKFFSIFHIRGDHMKKYEKKIFFRKNSKTLQTCRKYVSKLISLISARKTVVFSCYTLFSVSNLKWLCTEHFENGVLGNFQSALKVVFDVLSVNPRNHIHQNMINDSLSVTPKI